MKKIKHDFKVGQKIPTRNNSHIRIMAIAENYVMARHKGCMVFAKHIRDFKILVEERKPFDPNKLRD